ncbi:MAG: VTT domain-containing protein [Bryobacteraceae bacterium]|jgi:membrane-associated protein
MIHALLDFLRTLTTPDRLIHLLSTVLSGWLGYATLTAIVFAETGLLVGFIFPGDSLLFTIGVVAGAGHLNLTIMIVLLILACLAGDWCGYLLGRRTGPAIFDRPDSRFFKQEYLTRTNAFYAKHGGKTIIYAKFVPIIRTFAPFVAGVANMRYRSFVTFDVFGATGWVISMTVLGVLLGKIPVVQHNFEKFVLLVIFVSILPVIVHAVKGMRGRKPALQPGD